MRLPSRGLLLTSAFLILPVVAAAAEPVVPAPAATLTTIHVEAPTFPTPYQSAVVGLALTSVVVIGASHATDFGHDDVHGAGNDSSDGCIHRRVASDPLRLR